ncbi:NAD(P)-dependent oxidoreductase [Microbulbifer sp. M83]|uniref:NAD-dependent epimerase/dehydratase family protein n=1 Tax=unclassified Microbulbifer TaxID=2619833 RepID=UPI002FE02F01
MQQLTSALVTGADSIIGRRLVNQLLAEKVRVVAAVHPGRSIPTAWAGRVTIIRVAARPITDLAENHGPVDTVFQIGNSVAEGPEKTAHTDRILTTTRQSINLALMWDAHLVATTSIRCYGTALGKGILDERTPTGAPGSSYSSIRQQEEAMIREAVAKIGLKATIIRPGNVYGSGEIPWVGQLISRLQARQPCLIGRGNWDAGLVHMDNLVALLIAAARSPLKDGQLFVAGDGFGVTWEQFLRALARAVGTRAPRSIPRPVARVLAILRACNDPARHRPQRPWLNQQTYRLMGGPNQLVPARAERLLGYRPVTTFENAMQDMARLFRNPPPSLPAGGQRSRQKPTAS